MKAGGGLLAMAGLTEVKVLSLSSEDCRLFRRIEK